MPRLTDLQIFNSIISEFLTLPLMTAEDKKTCWANSLCHLGKNTGSTVPKDNPNPEDKAWIFIAKYANDIYSLGLDLDHYLPRSKGGCNHYTNIYPLPKRLNKAKGDGFVETDADLESLLSTEDVKVRKALEIPDNFIYANVKEWLLANYGK